jgi:hypothetical protein
MGVRRTLRCRASRPRWCVGAAVVSAVLIVLMPRAACAEPVSGSASFDERFSPADVSGPPKQGTANLSAVPSKSEPPSPREGDARTRYRAMIEREATQLGLAPAIAEAVMAVESGYDPAASGGAGEVGLMQILPSTASMLGFAGSLTELAVPATNIHYGVTYLAQAWHRAGGDLCTAVMKYRAGHGETRFSYRSVDYCLAVRSKLIARGFPVTGSVPVATFGGATFGGTARGCGRKCFAGSRIGHVDIAALNMRLSALVIQARGGR